jgi:RNA polymerase sigma-70 factor (ECF subfamily)
MFNEGYNASHGDSIVRRDLCQEAIRLGDLLLRRPETAEPPTHALMALMLLQASRLSARSAPADPLILLEDQDRSHWDHAMIARGVVLLDRAAVGDRLTRYHLEAGIAAEHATAASWSGTDWLRILDYYDRLETLAPSPVVTLNRAVALAMAQGPEAGLVVLDRLEGSLSDYYLLHAVRAELLVRSGRREEAGAEYQRALSLADTRPERPWLLQRQARLGP